MLAYVCLPRDELHRDAPFAETHERPMAFVEHPAWDEDEERATQTGWPAVVAKEGSD